MQVVGLDDLRKQAVRGDWENRGASLSDLASLEADFAYPSRWYGVESEGKVNAVFEVSSAPNYLKNMKVHFAPDFSLDLEGLDYDGAKSIIFGVVDALGAIFTYHLRCLGDGTSQVKIYNDSQDVRLIFYHFCRYLEDSYPDKYKFKFYGKWLEIHSK
jgi:hypothetical protein